MKPKFLTKTVIFLSVVSFFTDVSSEMLYPIMPLFLKSIGFSVLLIGVLEGIAEAAAGLSKGYFGGVSDSTGKRLPFVRIGYLLSAISKPLMALLAYPLWIFFARTLDRFGKGIRTGARDALLSEESTKENKAKVFGFHRSMDTFGAVIGPVSALIYLSYFPEDYKTLLLISFVPGMLAVLFTLFLKEKSRQGVKPISQNTVNFATLWNYLKASNPEYKKLIIGLLAFTLINSSDMFLLLRMKDVGLNDLEIIQTYIFYNAIYALLAYPFGAIGDKLGLKNTYIIGLVLFGITYTGMAFEHSFPIYIFFFFLYGAFSAATEGISKAWISNICGKEVGTAIGIYAGLNSMFALLSSSIAGLLWYFLGSQVLFFAIGGLMILVIIYFLTLKNPS